MFNNSVAKITKNLSNMVTQLRTPATAEKIESLLK